MSVAARLKRFYPYGETLTHSLGYMGKINQQDVILLEEQEKTARYAATQNIGKLGIEKFYEDQLHGEVGYEEVEVNNRGRIIRTHITATCARDRHSTQHRSRHATACATAIGRPPRRCGGTQPEKRRATDAVFQPQL